MVGQSIKTYQLDKHVPSKVAELFKHSINSSYV